ncbi:fatty acid desaturase [Psychromicrobium silvestre]|uniref:Fatty acid desaturase n=1 Tax=Psychromicrobium silvestre TaxID=1645614 RepID=A0A7Y9LTK2_9MICC|nr:acyl-CoA desaturase [Psychromicrobium silvestre]NYE95337.1 fatty acid desaturase [Psychromicrobium silvestre]
MSTAAVDRGSRPVRNQQAVEFIELAEQVRDAGLMRRDIGWYVGRMIRLGLGFIATGVMFWYFGESWWQLLTAVVFSFFCAQAGFLAHDAAHRQIFASAKANEWTGRVVGNLFVGLSYGWWMYKHGKHHANPNKIDSDPDISAGTVVFDPDDALKRKGFPRWFAAHQGYFFFPLLTLVGLGLHVDAVKRVFSFRETVPQRRWEIGFLVVRLLGVFVAAMLVCGPGIGLAFMGVHLATFGLYMGGSFAPNHKGMPLVPKNVKIDFLRRQTLMSRNISGGWLVDAGMGGLNYQIEHHLFPTMSSRNLRRAQPIVRAFCAERGIKYTETKLWPSYLIVMRYLNRVGLGQRDPFECPVTAQLRSAR